MDASTGPWCRPTTNSHLDCCSLQLLLGEPGLSQGLGSSLMFRSGVCQSLEVPSCQRTLTLILSYGVIRVAGSQLEVHCPVPQTHRRRGTKVDIIPDESQSSSSSSLMQDGTLPEFLDQWRTITSS